MESATLELQQAPASPNGTVVTRLNGKLALETVNTFIQTMRQEPATHLVLDMSGLSFLDSSGVGALGLSVREPEARRKNAGAGELDQAGNCRFAGFRLNETDSYVRDGG